MAITKLQPFNLDSTANYTFANVTATNANLGNAATANYFIGSGNNLSNIQAANITGTITATTAGTVTTNAQPNITSVGTLTSVSVSGNATIGNLSVSGVVNTNLIPVGNGVQSLGNATNQWSNLYLTGNTIYLGNATISSNASSIVLTTPTGGQTVIAGNTGNSDISGQTLSISGNATIGNIISSGGNITGANVISANLLTGTLTTGSQPNLTSHGTLTSLSVSGISNLGAVGNVTITGGSSGQVLSTNGSGGLSFISVSSAGVSNGNSNVNIATANGNVTITSAGNTTMTITGTGANVSGTLSVSGNATIGNIISSGSGGNITGANVISANLFTGTLTTAAQPNITSTGTLASLSVTGNGTFGNVSATTFTGALSGAATSATTAGTVTTAAQPNITSTGTLASISVSGTSNLGAVGNVTITGGSSGQVLSTNGSGGLSFISVSSSGISNGNSNVNIATANGNVTITAVGNTTMTVTGTGANISGTLSVSGNAAFANLTSNGTGGNITGANVISANTISVSGNATIGNIVSSGTGGNITGANVISANLFTGTLTTAAQPNITSVGTLASLSVTGNITGGNITIPGTANISTFVGNVFFGSVPAQPTWYTVAPLNLNNSLAAATKPQLNLINTGGGAGAGSAIDFYTYQISVAAANAESRIAAIDDGNYSAYLSLQTKTPGSTGTNGLVERVKIDSTGASVAGNVTGGNLITGGLISATGNLNAGNIITGGIVSATGNITANFFIGNGSQLTGLSSAGVSNGNSNISIATAAGNVTTSVNGNANILVVTGTGANVNGTLSVSGNAAFANLTSNGTGGNITGANVISANTVSVSGNATIGNIVSSGSGGNITGANVISANLFTGTLTTGAQPNITSVGTLASLTINSAIGLGGATYGSSGQVLTSAGSGAVPTWTAPSAGAMTLLATVNVTSGTYATINGYFTSDYDTYLVVGNDLVGSSPGNALYVQVAVASTFQTSSYKYNGQGASGSTSWNTGVYASSAGFINILGPLSSYEVASVNMYIFSPLNTSREKLFNWFNGISYTDPGFTVGNGRWAGGTSALSGIRIYWNSGNWSAGTFRLYGLKNS